MPKIPIYWEVRRVKISLTQRVLQFEKSASIGIGSLIIFIAMILVAGMAASVVIQTMNTFVRAPKLLIRESLS